MKSARRGRNTSRVEVLNISRHGFWILAGSVEHFVPFKNYPWFRSATVEQLMNVQLPSADHLYWPDLDVDISIESLEHPEKFPLVSRVGTVYGPDKKTSPPATIVRESRPRRRK